MHLQVNVLRICPGKISQPASDLPLLRVKTHSSGQLCACTTPGSVVLAICFANKGGTPQAHPSGQTHTPKKEQQRLPLKEKRTPVKVCGKGLW